MDKHIHGQYDIADLFTTHCITLFYYYAVPTGRTINFQTDFLCRLIKRYLFSVSISAFCLLLLHG